MPQSASFACSGPIQSAVGPYMGKPRFIDSRINSEGAPPTLATATKRKERESTPNGSVELVQLVVIAKSEPGHVQDMNIWDADHFADSDAARRWRKCAPEDLLLQL